MQTKQEPTYKGKKLNANTHLLLFMKTHSIIKTSRQSFPENLLLPKKPWRYFDRTTNITQMFLSRSDSGKCHFLFATWSTMCSSYYPTAPRLAELLHVTLQNHFVKYFCLRLLFLCSGSTCVSSKCPFQLCWPSLILSKFNMHKDA